jgi:hypothetical protein
VFSNSSSRAFDLSAFSPRPYNFLYYLTLAFDMISTFRNVPLGLGKVVFEQIALHALQRPVLPKRSFRETI